MKLIPLGIQEMAANDGASHIAVVTHADLTEATAATAQTVALATVGANVSARVIKSKVIVPFEDVDDADHNTTAVTVGDGGSATRFLASQEMNVNGAEVLLKLGSGTELVYTVDDTVDAFFTAPAAGKTLAALDKGEVHFFLQIQNGTRLPQ